MHIDMACKYISVENQIAKETVSSTIIFFIYNKHDIILKYVIGRKLQSGSVIHLQKRAPI